MGMELSGLSKGKVGRLFNIALGPKDPFQRGLDTDEGHFERDNGNPS